MTMGDSDDSSTCVRAIDPRNTRDVPSFWWNWMHRIEISRIVQYVFTSVNGFCHCTSILYLSWYSFYYILKKIC